MAKLTPAEVLVTYGLTLMICGALAFMAAGEAKKALSSIYMGNGGALVTFMLALGTRNMKLTKGETGYKSMMICIHLAFVFPFIYAAAVGWRLALAWNVPAKAYLKPYFIIIIVASLLTSLFIYLEKPKKNKNSDKKNEGKSAEQTTNVESKDTEGTTIKRKSRKASAM